MAYTDNNIEKLIVNTLTSKQYQTLKSSGQISENELYMTTDDTFATGNSVIAEIGTDSISYYSHAIPLNAEMLHSHSGDVDIDYFSGAQNISFKDSFELQYLLTLERAIYFYLSLPKITDITYFKDQFQSLEISLEKAFGTKKKNTVYITLSDDGESFVYTLTQSTLGSNVAIRAPEIGVPKLEFKDLPYGEYYFNIKLTLSEATTISRDILIYSIHTSVNRLISVTDVNGNTYSVNAFDENQYYTKEEVDSKISSVYKYKGSVANRDSLPTTGLTVGDVYNLEDTGMNVAWTGTSWDNLGATIDVDLADYATKAELTAVDNKFQNKQDTLVSGTNIKTINGTSLLGSGDITISAEGGVTEARVNELIAAYMTANYEDGDQVGY